MGSAKEILLHDLDTPCGCIARHTYLSLCWPLLTSAESLSQVQKEVCQGE